MQPSPVEIQREVEALRDIRRRSTAQGGPGSLVLDPDLPNESSPSSPTAGYWTSGSTPGLTNGESSSSSHEDGSSSERSAADDPFHLFWVPARLHPEIAPTEFRAFLKEHARGPSADGSGPLSRSPSNVSVSSRLGRRTSMLSNQFDPNASDVTETEHILPLRRNRSSIYNSGPQLTINDLQKLDELAEEASRSDDPTRLRSILRRSLSLNVAPSGMSIPIYLTIGIFMEVNYSYGYDGQHVRPWRGCGLTHHYSTPRPNSSSRSTHKNSQTWAARGWWGSSLWVIHSTQHNRGTCTSRTGPAQFQ